MEDALVPGACRGGDDGVPPEEKIERHGMEMNVYSPLAQAKKLIPAY
jgi:hypothetical protein